MTTPVNKVEKEGFASRWSRRKQQLKLDQKAIKTAADDSANERAEVTPDNDDPTSTEKARVEKLAELNTLKDEDMPDIATLDENSDFSQFMSVNVSENLRKLALRKLFQGSTYNVRDGLDEYDGDYTSFEKLSPGTVTADMKYRQELEAEKLKTQLEEESTDENEALSDEDTEAPDDAENINDETSESQDKNRADSGSELPLQDEPGTIQAEIEPADDEQTARKKSGK